MLNNKERKMERMHSGLPDTLSANMYNLIIGGCIVYGFLLNAVIVWNFADLFADMNYIVFLIGYVVCCLAGSFMTVSKSPLVSFIGYNLVVVPIGAVLSICLPAYSIDVILSAIVVTGIVVTIMMILSTLHPQFFAGLGRTLFFSLLIGVVVELIATLLGYGGNIFNWAFVLIFSLYVGFDWSKAQSYPKTLDNAIDSALDLYLDIINLFIRLLDILAKRDD